MHARALVVLALFGALFAVPAAASDLDIGGEQAAVIPIGSPTLITLSGGSGKPALLLLDVTPGPSVVFGESVALGFTPLLTIVAQGVTDLAGDFVIPAVVPDDPALAGATAFLVGVLLDAADPNGKDFSNGASLTVSLPVGAGATQATLVGRPVVLDGSGSTNALGNLPTGTSILWELLASPPGSNPTLQLAGTVYPILTPDLPGDYVVRATLTGTFASYTAETTVHAYDLALTGLGDGSFIDAASTFVSGDIAGPDLAAASMNGVALAVDAGGNFGPVREALPAGGVHHALLFELVHTDGTLTRERLTLQQGNAGLLFLPSVASLSAQVEAADLDEIAVNAEAILAGSDLESVLLALPPQQVANTEGPFGFTIFSATIDFTGLSHGPIDLQMSPSASGILGTVTMPDVRADFNVFGEVLEIDYSLDGYITSDPTVIAATLVGSAAGGQIHVGVTNIVVDRQNFDFELTGFIGTVAEAFVIESSVKEEVEATIAGFVATDLGPAVEELLNGFVIAGNLFETIEVDVDVSAPITGVVHSNHGVSVRLNGLSTVGSAEPGSPFINTYRSTPSPAPVFGSLTPSGQPYGSALSLADDFVNQVLAASTGAGLLDGDLTSLIPTKGKVPVSLVVDELAVLFPGGGFDLFPAGVEALLDAHGTVPLVLEITPGGPGQGRLIMSNLEVEFLVPTPAGDLPLLRVAVDGSADVELGIGEDLALSADVIGSELSFTALRSFPGADPAVIDVNVGFLEVVLNFAIPEIVSALGGIPLPSLEAQGLGLIPSEVSVDGDHIVFWGDLQTDEGP